MEGLEMRDRRRAAARRPIPCLELLEGRALPAAPWLAAAASVPGLAEGASPGKSGQAALKVAAKHAAQEAQGQDRDEEPAHGAGRASTPAGEREQVVNGPMSLVRVGELTTLAQAVQPPAAQPAAAPQDDWAAAIAEELPALVPAIDAALSALAAGVLSPVGLPESVPPNGVSGGADWVVPSPAGLKGQVSGGSEEALMPGEGAAPALTLRLPELTAPLGHELVPAVDLAAALLVGARPREDLLPHPGGSLPALATLVRGSAEDMPEATGERPLTDLFMPPVGLAGPTGEAESDAPPEGEAATEEAPWRVAALTAGAVLGLLLAGAGAWAGHTVVLRARAKRLGEGGPDRG
jgi:hypothetical protein